MAQSHQPAAIISSGQRLFPWRDPFRDHGIDRVQSSGVDLNENFIRLGHRPRPIGERDVIGSAIPFEDERFHVLPVRGPVRGN
jgi:hypothetical protein